MFTNETKRVIEMSAAEYKAAMTYATEEYKALRELRQQNPGFKTSVAKVKKPKIKDKLNLKEIKAYVKAHGSDDQKAQFETIAFPRYTENGVIIEAQSFFEIKQWFYAEFPEYKKALEDHEAAVKEIFKAVEAKIDAAKAEAAKAKREVLEVEVAEFRKAS